MSVDVERRARAIKRLEAKRGFRAHLTVWAAFAVFFVVIWALTDRTYFWPVWPILGWGIGVFFHGWGVYGQKGISEEDIRRELQREPGSGSGPA